MRVQRRFMQHAPLKIPSLHEWRNTSAQSSLCDIGLDRFECQVSGRTKEVFRCGAVRRAHEALPPFLRPPQYFPWQCMEGIQQVR